VYFLPRLHSDRNWDFVLWMHLLVAGIAAWLAAQRLHLGWWSAGVALAVFVVPTLSLKSRYTFFVGAAVGTIGSALSCAGLGLVIVVSVTSSRPLLYAAMGLGAVGGVAMAVSVYRKIIPRRE
jgi:hypothetical protein